MFEVGHRVLDRYVVEAVLGQGGMATVYRVRHAALGSLHALKVLDLPTAGIKSRFLQEGRIQASLRHPNVVSVTDALDLDGRPALVMEFVEGRSLADLLAERRPSIDEGLGWFREILGAVGYAHDRGLVHRDLKPDNILMSPRPEGFAPKVADFGIAKVVSDWMAEREGPKTRAGIGMGTPAYMAPEQVNDAGGVDARADVFALGCILYELVCGRKAFEGENVLSVLTAASRGDYPRPEALDPGLPAGVVVAIHAALQPDRARRPSSCEALAALLDAGRPAAPLVERPSSTGLWLALSALFGLALFAGLGMIGVVAVGGLGLAAWTTRAVDTGVRLVISDDDPDEQVMPSADDPPDAPVVPPSPPPPFRVAVEVHGQRTARSVRDGVIGYEAGPGEQLLLVRATVRNLTDEEVGLFFPWSVLDADDQEHDAEMSCAMALQDDLDPVADLEPRQVLTGELCFEVPVGARGLRLRLEGAGGPDDVIVIPL